MKPKSQEKNLELFKVQLDDIVNKDHPLVRLSQSINWDYLTKEIGQTYDEQMGAPGKSIRLMVGLHYLKYLYDESDEMVVVKFLENPYWQYFCGNQHFEHSFPIEPSSMTRFRKRIGKKEIEKFLKETINAANTNKEITQKSYEQLNADTTVEEKAITFPTDAKLYYKMREVLVKASEKRGIKLRQSYKRVSKKALAQQSRYAHAKQMKRSKKMVKKLKTYLGRVYRDIDRKVEHKDKELVELMGLASRLLSQEKNSKKKLYSIHSPEVECISKGKAHKRYEFGCKVSMVTTSKDNWIVGIQALEGNPYDGHSLKEAIEQSEEITGWKAKNVNVDLGYRGHNYQGEAKINIVNRRTVNKKDRKLKKWLKRRSAIEPIFGHLKSENRLKRNLLKGKQGDHINAVLSGCGFNLRKLYRVFLCPIIEKAEMIIFGNICFR